MSYAMCCNRLTTSKHWEHVVFLLRNRTPQDILLRNLHTILIKETFSTRSREGISKDRINCHYYHKSNGWIDNDFKYKNSYNNLNDHSGKNKWKFERTYFGNDKPDFDRPRGNSNNHLRRENYDFFNDRRNKGSLLQQDRNIDILEPPDWNSEKLPEIIKDCYIPHPDVTSRNPSAVEEYRKAQKITVSGAVVPNPIKSFSETNFPSYILKEFENSGFKKPTPIQAQAWPVVMSGHNLIGIGQTGSGKTIGYVVPAIVHINRQLHKNEKNAPVVVILAPTRELAQQICSVTIQFGRSQSIRSACLVGGQSILHQLKQLQMSPQICVATPGRLLDHLKNKRISLKNCSYLVIDEADRMLDMGFEPQIQQIIQQIRPDRQIVMWSASWPQKIVPLANKYIQDPVNITIGQLDGGANEDITQFVDVCARHEKMDRLKQLLDNIYKECKQDTKILIFVNMKRMAEVVAFELDCFGFKSLCLHGGKRQATRDHTIHAFREAKNAILVATDVAARGLDVPNINYVINMDCPNNSEQYIHRIGRTARSGKKGTSYTFITCEDKPFVRDLINILEECNQEVNPKLWELLRKQSFHSRNWNT